MKVFVLPCLIVFATSPVMTLGQDTRHPGQWDVKVGVLLPKSATLTRNTTDTWLYLDIEDRWFNRSLGEAYFFLDAATTSLGNPLPGTHTWSSLGLGVGTRTYAGLSAKQSIAFFGGGSVGIFANTSEVSGEADPLNNFQTTPTDSQTWLSLGNRLEVGAILARTITLSLSHFDRGIITSGHYSLSGTSVTVGYRWTS